MHQPVRFVFAPHFSGISVNETFRETKMNKQFVHLLHHILQIMVDGREVQREEAVPKSEFAQEIQAFTFQCSFPGNTENYILITRCQDPVHVTHGKQVVLVKVVC